MGRVASVLVSELLQVAAWLRLRIFMDMDASCLSAAARWVIEEQSRAVSRLRDAKWSCSFWFLVVCFVGSHIACGWCGLMFPAPQDGTLRSVWQVCFRFPLRCVSDVRWVGFFLYWFPSSCRLQFGCAYGPSWMPWMPLDFLQLHGG